MPITKPQPLARCTVRREEKKLFVTPAYVEIEEWIEENLPEYGILYPPTGVTSYYLLFVKDVYDAAEVANYIRTSFGIA